MTHLHHSRHKVENLGVAASHSSQLEGNQMGLRGALDLACLSGPISCLTEAHKCGACTQHWASVRRHETRSSCTVWQPAGWTSGVLLQGFLLSLGFTSSEGAALALCKAGMSFEPGHRSLRPQRHTKLSSKTIPNSQCIKGLLVYSFDSYYWIHDS